jgi:hypothetical protein
LGASAVEARDADRQEVEILCYVLLELERAHLLNDKVKSARSVLIHEQGRFEIVAKCAGRPADNVLATLVRNSIA